MKCEAYRILITGYIDNALSDNETRMLKQHLGTCESCLQHLQRQEVLRTTLKRYAFLQEPPAVPSNFAQKVTAQLESLHPESVPVFQPKGVTHRIRRGVLRFVDAWSVSLNARPFAWTATVSCVAVLLVGIVALNVFYTPSPNQMARVETKAPAEQAVSQVAMSVETEPLPNAIADTDSSSLFEVGFIEEQQALPVSVQAQKPPLKGYVYSHVVGGYQDRLIDDIMFVGYAQDAVIQ